MNHVLYIIPILLAFTIPNAFALENGETVTDEELNNLIITGTLFLNSDDFVDETIFEDEQGNIIEDYGLYLNSLSEQETNTILLNQGIDPETGNPLEIIVYPNGVYRSAETLYETINDQTIAYWGKYNDVPLGKWLPTDEKNDYGLTIYKSYFLSDNDNELKIESGHTSFIVDKNSCELKLYEGGIITNNSQPTVLSDEFISRHSVGMSDTWIDSTTNNADCFVSYVENDDTLNITTTREDVNGLLLVKYIFNNVSLKQQSEYTNYSEPNSKFGFSQKIKIPRNIIIDGTNIDLIDFDGLYLERNWILENNATVLEVMKDMNYDMDIGFDQLWGIQINVDESIDKAIITFDYVFQSEPLLIGETVILDPSYIWGSPVSGSMQAGAGNNGNSWAGCNNTTSTGLSETMNGIFTTDSYSSSGARTGNWPYNGVTYPNWPDTNLMNNGVRVYSAPNGGSAHAICDVTYNMASGGEYVERIKTVHSSNKANVNSSEQCNIVGYYSTNNKSTWTQFMADSTCKHYLTAFVGGGLQIQTDTATIQQTVTNVKYVVSGYSSTKRLLEVQTERIQLTAPTAPQSLTTSQSTANEIILNYLAPSDDGGSSITNYEIYLNGSLIDTIGNVLTYTDTISGGEIGANLVYSVKAINAIGSSVVSSNSNISSWDVPDQVTGLTAQTGNPIILNWNVPASDDTITNYEIKRDGTVLTTVGAVTTYSDNSLVGGTNYSYEISAISAVGQGVYSSSANAMSGLPWNVPTNLSATVSDVNATPLLINLSWDASTQGSGTGTLTGYELFVDGVSIGTVGIVTSSTYQLTNPGTYDFTIKSLSNHADSVTGNISSVTTPTIPGAPSLTLAINDPNNLPLDITSTFIDGPTGGSAITGFNLYYSSDDITYSSIVNNTNSDYTYSVSNSGTHYFKSEAINNVGTGTLSTAYSSTTPNVPDTITDLSGNVISDTQINISWTAPNDNGSNVDLYKIFKDGVQVDTTTNTNYSLTGLLSNTSYTITVYANNSVGDSLVSNTVNLTTYQSVSGSITVTSNTQGASSQLTFSASGITGTPTPIFSTFTLKEGITVIASGISSPYTLTLNDNNSHTYTITSTDNTHWNTPTISGSTTVTASYSPTWNNNISYNYTRASGVMDLTVNKDVSSVWDATCNYKTTAQVMADQSGIVSNFTNVWYINDSQNIADTDTVYVSCSDDGTQLFAFTSFGPNRLGGGIAQLDDVFGDMTGTPVALIFVLLVAGLFTGRSAPTGILLVLALIGVLGFIGMLTIDEAVWGFLLLAGVLGIFLGKRFL